MGSRRTRGDRRKFPIKVSVDKKDHKIAEFIDPYLQPLDSKWKQ